MQAETFSTALTLLLKRRMINRAEFARRIGVTPAAVSGWTGGHSLPSSGRVEQLIELLAVAPPEDGELRRLWYAASVLKSTPDTNEVPDAS